MIWFFLAGMIAGAVGLYKYAEWVVRRDAERIRKLLNEKKKEGE